MKIPHLEHVSTAIIDVGFLVRIMAGMLAGLVVGVTIEAMAGVVVDVM